MGHIVKFLPDYGVVAEGLFYHGQIVDVAPVKPVKQLIWAQNHYHCLFESWVSEVKKTRNRNRAGGVFIVIPLRINTPFSLLDYEVVGVKEQRWPSNLKKRK